MISFKAFVNAIHDAVLQANEALMDKNTDLLNKYFVDKTVNDLDEAGKPVLDSNGNAKKKNIKEPVSAILDYPVIDYDGNLKKTEIHVPLITLVPMASSQVEKATLKADFEMFMDNDELQINFVKETGGVFSKSKTSRGSFEITISPQEPSEGMQILIDGYEKVIKRQLP